MLDLYDELTQVTAALDAEGVPYALAGGLAVSLYTRPRATKDIELLLSAAEGDRAVACLQPLGYRPHQDRVPLAKGRLHLLRLQKLAAADYLLVDLLLAHQEPELGILESRVRTPPDAGGHVTWVVTRDGLRQLKLLRGSPQDQADLRALEEEEDGA